MSTESNIQMVHGEIREQEYLSIFILQKSVVWAILQYQEMLRSVCLIKQIQICALWKNQITK